MANPYYIPRKAPLERVLPFLQLGLQAYGAHQDVQANKARLAAEQTRLGLAERESIAKYGQDVPVGLGGPKDPGVGMAMNLPGGRTGTMAHVFGSEQRAEMRERQKMGLLEQAGLREERGPLKVHDRYMSEMPDVERLSGFGQRIPALSGYSNELVEAINAGKIKTRWDAYRYIKDRGPEIGQSLDAEIARMKKSGQDTAALEEFRAVAKQGTFAEQLFQFPAERMPKIEKGPTFSTTEAGVRLKAQLAKEDETDYDETDYNALSKQVGEINKILLKGTGEDRYPLTPERKAELRLTRNDLEAQMDEVRRAKPKARARETKSYGASDQPEGTVARNPKTGERIITKNGKWVSAQE